MLAALVVGWALTAAAATDTDTQTLRDSPIGGSERATSASPLGTFSASVPLDLPAPRGRLTVPLSVTYGGDASVGAAGAGWHIPLAYVRRSTTIARRKPIHLLGPAPTVAAERVFLALHGAPVLMSKTGEAGVYHPFAAAEHVTLVQQGPQWWAYDAAGTAYLFQRLPDQHDETLWYLTRITDRTGANSVQLSYEVEALVAQPAELLGDEVTGAVKQVLLRDIAYSWDAGASCPKHRVNLQYGHYTPDGAYLDVSFSEGHMEVRTKILQRIAVASHTGSSCTEPGEEVLRTYRFAYEDDADTGKPRLVSVDLYGKGDDASDPSTSLPVTRYAYGSATGGHATGGSALVFGAAEMLTLPGSSAATNAGFDTIARNPFGDYEHIQTLTDLTSDGRADHLGYDEAGVQQLLSANVPAADGSDTTTLPGSAAYDAASPAVPRNVGSSPAPVLVDGYGTSVTDTWQQVIDWNGDGRPDIVHAARGRNPEGDFDPDYWRVQLNTPGASGDVSDITWVETHVNISYLRALMIERNHQLSLQILLPGADEYNSRRALPLSRLHAVGAWPKDEPALENGTVTLWKLLDMNGDTYPDFVFNWDPPTSRSETRCDAAGECVDAFVHDVPDGGPLAVVYHTGVLMAGAGLDGWSKWSGPYEAAQSWSKCGVERVIQRKTEKRQLVCGWIEANGDGLADFYAEDFHLVTGGRSLRMVSRGVGIPRNQAAALPENSDPPDPRWHNIKRGIFVPGPLNVIDRPLGGCDGLPGSAIDLTRQISGLQDLTGDGIADYAYYGTRGRLASGEAIAHPDVDPDDGAGTPPSWWVMVGMGIGFRTPIPVQTPPGVWFELAWTWERCDGLSTNVNIGLADLNGDGRPELVAKNTWTGVTVSSIVGVMGGKGALDAGRLVRVDGGYGAVTELAYGNAKADHRTAHQIPQPEVVLSRETVRAQKGLGPSMAPTRFAYGGARLQFHPLLGTWVFPGYERRVAQQGRTVQADNHGEQLVIRGIASIADAVRPGDLATTYERYVLTGGVRDLHTLDGEFPADPRTLLGVDLSLDGRWHRNEHIDYALARTDVDIPPLLPLEEECYDFDPFTPGWLSFNLCRHTAVSYPKHRTTWEGSAPWPSEQSIATRTTVQQVDEYGRPTQIDAENDRATDEDNVCVEIGYAIPTADGPPVRNAVASLRLRGCQDTTQVYAGSRWEYDGLPEGQVNRGLVTGKFVERYNAYTGELIEPYDPYTGEPIAPTDERDRAFTAGHDAFGNVTSVIRLREDGVQQTTTYVYDAFGLTVEHAARTASDVPGVTLTSDTVYDPVLLLPVRSTDVNGTALGTAYDRFGRHVLTSVTLPTGPTEYALMSVEPLGDNPTDPAGRRQRYRVFHDWVPVTDVGPATESTAVVSVVTDHFDELDRFRYRETSLGSDYGGARIISKQVQRDELGRAVFAADPFESSEPGDRYGTTFTHLPDGRLRCAIRGVGVQVPETTDEASDRYPHCYEYVYEHSRHSIRTQGPNERLSGSPEYQAYDEQVVTALGRVLSRARWQAGARLELADFAYDKLGQLIQMRRYGTPATPADPITWQLRSDSLGQLLSFQEPGLSNRRRHYDRWGQLARTMWLDTSASPPVERGSRRRYDGFGRLRAAEQIKDGAVDPASLNNYAYDVASGDPNHVSPHYLRGRLSYATGEGMTTFFGYDELGRTVSTSRVLDGRRFVDQVTLTPHGEPTELRFLLPDSGTERVDYTYDSARRLRTVRWQDTESLFQAEAIDPFGRYRTVRLGNGVVESYDYRPDRRRELLEQRIAGPGYTLRTSYGGYDGETRLRGRTVEVLADPPWSRATSYTYNAREQLARALSITAAGGPGWISEDQYFGYDALGNLRQIDDAVAASTVTFVPFPADPDRLCRRSGDPASPDCTYTYDALGNVVRIQDPDSPPRVFEYDAESRLVRMTKGPLSIGFRHGAFGERVQVDVWDEATPISRRHRHLGPLLGESIGPDSSFIERRIPSPMGTLAVRRKRTDGGDVLIFPHGDSTANRAFTDAAGHVTQRVEYRPYGEITEDTGVAGSVLYSPYLWNGGETFKPFGLTLLGARAYDPASGRFLQRDPMMVFRGASLSHPYMFAFGDPVNFADPSGLDAEGRVDNSLWWPTVVPWDEESLTQLWMWPDGTTDLIYPDGTGMRLVTPEDAIVINHNYTAELERRKREAYTDSNLALARFIAEGTAYGTGGVLAGAAAVALVPETAVVSLARAALWTETALDVGNVGVATAGVIRDPSLVNFLGLGVAAGDLLSGPNIIGDFNTARLAIPASERRTRGILVTPHAAFKLTSGNRGGPRAMQLPGRNNNVMHHVEAHAAQIMRTGNVQSATLYINRVPCTSSRPGGCYEMLPHMLPPGARLRVIGPGGYDEPFEGLPDDPSKPRD